MSVKSQKYEGNAAFFLKAREPVFYLVIWLWRSIWKDASKNFCPEQPVKCKER